MADATVIKEFLVALGFREDPAKLARFVKGIDDTTKRIAGLGKSMVDTGKEGEKSIGGVTDQVGKLHEAAKRPDFLEAMANWKTGLAALAGGLATVAIATVKITARLDDMLLAARRAGSSPETLEPLRRAADIVGIGAGSIEGAIDAMRLRMATLPGLANLLDSFGVSATDAAGNMRDTAQVFQQLIPAMMQRAKQLGPSGFAIVSQQAQLFGIDPATLQQLFDNWGEITTQAGKFRAEVAAGHEPLATMAQRGHDVAESMRAVASSLQLAMEQGLVKWKPELDKIIAGLDALVDKFRQLDEVTKGWMTAGAAALLAIGGGSIAGGLTGLLGGAVGGAAGGALAGGAGGLAAVLGPIVAAIGAALLAALTAWAAPEIFTSVKKTLDDIYQLLATGKAPATGPTGIPLPQRQGDPGTFSWWKQQVLGALGGFQDWIDSLGKRGGAEAELQQEMDKEQPSAPGAGGRGRSVRPGAGPRRATLGLVDAIQAAESGGERDPVHALSPAGAQGLMQLMPDTGKELAAQVGEKYSPYDPEQNRRLGARYISQLLDQYGGNLVDALAAYNWGMGNVDKWLRATAGDFTKLPVETQHYIEGIFRQLNDSNGLLIGQPLYGGSSANVVGDFNTSMKTEIHVVGGADPLQTARAVASAQGRVGGDMIRNLRGLSQDFVG